MTVERERQSQAREDREHGAKGVSRLREVEDGEERRHQERDQRREPERETHHRGMSEPVDRGDHDSMAGSRRAVREHDAPLLRPDETRCARVAGADAGARPQIDRAQPWRWRTLAGRQQMTRWTPGSCRSSPENARGHEQLDRPPRRGLGGLYELYHRCDGHDWVTRQELEEPQCNDRHPILGEHVRAVRGDEREQLPRGGDRLVGDRRDPVEEEVEPAFPVALYAHRVEATVVVLAVPFEEEAQVEQRLGQQLPVLEQQCHEQASDAAVAVEVRVDGLELHVQEPGRTSGGSKSSACRYFSNPPSSSPSACGGGGTYAALPGRLPPIQFWLRRTSPGSFSAPRTPCMSR
jgi:hypothetical protein